MNLCFFSRVNYWQGQSGGMEIHGKMLAEGLVQKGHTVCMISTRHPEGLRFEKRNGVKIHYLSNTVFASRRKGWKDESIRKFAELHMQRPFDLACSQSFAAYGFCGLKRPIPIPILVILHGCIEQEIKTFLVSGLRELARPQRIIRKFGGLLFSYFFEQRPVLSRSDRLITVSDEVAGQVRKWFGEKIFEKCVTVLNGVDTKAFSPSRDRRPEIRKRYGIGERELLLLTLGRMNKEKGHHIAIEALKLLREKGQRAKLIVAGDGNYLNELKRIAANAGFRNDVIFAGFIENRETPKYYNGCDIFLMPTLTEEGLPIVLLEAMACGLPVISSRMGGIKSLIDHMSNGLLTEAGDALQTAEAILTLTQNPSLSEELGQAGVDCIRKRYSAERMVDRTMEVMMSLTR
jgi:glycosyltransferase involved in cell wall biosynthesis